MAASKSFNCTNLKKILKAEVDEAYYFKEKNVIRKKREVNLVRV